MTQPQENVVRLNGLGELRIGDWSIRQTEGLLCTGDRSIRLEPRVMDVLVYLAQHADRVVSKEELMAAVWGGAFVEEGALSQAVHSLRKVLGDDARQPRYIQTIPKRGYRLVAAVVAEERAKASEPSAEPPPHPDSRRLPLAAAVAVLFLVLVLLAILGMRFLADSAPAGERASAAGAPRIVVLPFQNLGQAKDAYFADGLTEEITKDLASLPALQVISRTSAVHYAGSRKSLPEIGRELKVDYVLEGTVRWAAGPAGGPRVRITPQLIRVADDSHVWADAFESEVEDIFRVQAEISRRVIAHFGITPMAQEKRLLRAPPTSSLEAYQAYLRGLELKNQPFYSASHVEEAISMFERAVRLDPGFAEAWAALSQARTYLAYNTDSSPAQLERARQACRRALTLAPDRLEPRLAEAYFTYLGREDFDAAQRQLAALSRQAPNNAEVLQTLGFVLRRQGRLTEAVEPLKRSFSLDPRTVKLVWAIAETYRALRNVDEADRFYEQAISLAPDQPVYWEEKALNRLAMTGELADARAVVADAPIPDHPGLVPVAFQLDFYERQYARALARLLPDRLAGLPPQFQSRVLTLAAIARERAGDRRGALAAAEENRKILAERVERFPRESFYRAYLAVALAQLGRRDEAIEEAERAVRQRQHDAFTGPRMVEIQAMVDTILGRRQEAVRRLARLLATAYQTPVTPADLRLSPVWDPLRGDPAFEDLLR